MSTKTWELTKKLYEEEENEFKIKTTDFFRQPLCQIGTSLSEIIEHYRTKGKINVIPSSGTSSLLPELSDIRADLLARLDDFRLCLLQSQNVATGELVENTIPEGLLFISRSIPSIFNVETIARPCNVKCDVMLLLPFQPIMFLTIAIGDPSTDDVKIYNRSVARGFTSGLIEYLDVDFKPVPGILHADDLKNTESFNKNILDAVKIAKLFLPRDPFSMNLGKFEKVLKAVWACIAKTSIISYSNIFKNHYHYLTKEQCVILVENIDSHNVKVKARSGTGATTLMLEVAKRLSRIGRTLLISGSKDAINDLRKYHEDTIWCADVAHTDLSLYAYIVDETNTAASDEGTDVWSFDTGFDRDGRRIEDMSVDELRERCVAIEKESYNKDILISELKLQLGVSETPTDKAELTELKGEIEHLRKENMKLSTEFEKLKMQLQQASTVSRVTVAGPSRLMETDVEMEVPVPVQTGSVGAAEKKRRLTSQSLESDTTNQPVKKRVSEQRLAVSSGTAVAGPSTETLECNPDVPFTCPPMKYDVSQVNISACHINKDNQLDNSKLDDNQDQGVDGFKHYWGTCSTQPLLLFEPHSPYQPGPQYWECTTDVLIKKKLKTLPLLEIGLSEEQDLDKEHWVCRLPRSWCIRIAVCGDHSKRICTQVFGERKKVRCLPERHVKVGTIPNEEDTKASVSYGVVVDVGRGRIGFLDLDREVVLDKRDVEFQETVYPLFAVGRIDNKVDVKMRLLSGNDITMTQQKKELIAEVLMKKPEEQ